MIIFVESGVQCRHSYLSRHILDWSVDNKEDPFDMNPDLVTSKNMQFNLKLPWLYQYINPQAGTSTVQRTTDRWFTTASQQHLILQITCQSCPPLTRVVHPTTGAVNQHIYILVYLTLEATWKGITSVLCLVLKTCETMLISDSVYKICLLYTSPSPRDQRGSRMPSSA